MKQVICLGTPLQIAAVVGGLVFRDGMGDPINLPPCLDDLRVLSMPNSTRQLISLHRNWRDDDGILHSSAWAVTAVGMGADKSTLEIFDNEPHWERIADAWAWLVSELAARGRIEGGPAEQQSATAGEAAAVINAARDEWLSPQDRQRLEYLLKDDNYLNKSDEELGQELSLAPDTVKKMRLKHGLRKRKARKGIGDTQTIPLDAP